MQISRQNFTEAVARSKESFFSTETISMTQRPLPRFDPGNNKLSIDFKNSKSSMKTRMQQCQFRQNAIEAAVYVWADSTKVYHVVHKKTTQIWLRIPDPTPRALPPWSIRCARNFRLSNSWPMLFIMEDGTKQRNHRITSVLPRTPFRSCSSSAGNHNASCSCHLETCSEKFSSIFSWMTASFSVAPMRIERWAELSATRSG